MSHKVEKMVLPHNHPSHPAKQVWVITTNGEWSGLSYYLSEGHAIDMLNRKLSREAKESIRKEAIRGLRSVSVMLDDQF